MATGGNGFGNFRAGNHYCDMLGRQREATDLVTFGLGITRGTRLGENGRQWVWSLSGRESLLEHVWEAMHLVTFRVGITTGTRLGGNGRQWI